MGARFFGLIGTLIVTRFVTPDAYGAVTIAAVLVMTANQLSSVGLGQYLVSRHTASRPAAFHATLIHVALGVVALTLLLLEGRRLGLALDVPGMKQFLPGLVVSALVDRVAFVPERVLVRELRFGIVGTGRTAGELVYSAGCIALAASGAGAMAIVLGNVARSLVRATVFISAADSRDWLEPCRLSFAKVQEMLRFGVPIALGALCSFASRRWDNLLVSRYFGSGPAGMYNLAYNLADVPAIHVGEQVGDVLLPSFARMDAEHRPAALARSVTLLALVVFPLAIGLGAVAPTVVAALFDPHWQPIGPMLVILSALSVARPIGWTIASYLQARHLPGLILALEVLKLAIMMLFIVILGSRSPAWTCVCVGIAFGAHAVASLLIVQRLDGMPVAPLLLSLARVLAACGPMVAAVLGMRFLLDRVAPMPAAIELIIETIVGILVYPPCALLLCGVSARDLVRRVVDAVRPATR